MALTKVSNSMQSSASVSVKDFGAVGDGLTNDTAAIQAAFDSVTSNAEIVFPQGVYIISDSGVGVDANGKSNITVTGDGAIIKVPSTALSSRPFVIRNSSNIEVRGITFDCQIPLGPTAQACNGLDIMNTTDAWIHDCKFIGQTFYGIGVYEDTIGGTSTSCAGLRVENCHFKDIGSIALEPFPKVVDGSCVISGCTFENCGNNVTGGGTGNAVKVGQGFEESTITGCTFIQSGDVTSTIAAGYYSKCAIVNNTFSNCRSINIAIGILDHPLGVDGSFESLIINANTFIADSSETNSNGLIEIATSTSGIAIYDASLGAISITNNTVENTSLTVPFALMRPMNNVARFSFVGNVGNNLGNSLLAHDDARGGIFVDGVVSKNSIRMSAASTTYAISYIKADGGAIVDNDIYNTSQYSIQAGQHTNAQFISGNRFFKCNRSATASRGPILLGTFSGYVPADVYLYGNVVLSTEYAALVLASAAYNIYHANNVMPKIATTSTPVEFAEATFGNHTTNADAPVNGYITIKDQFGTDRKLATIA